MQTSILLTTTNNKNYNFLYAKINKKYNNMLDIAYFFIFSATASGTTS